MRILIDSAHFYLNQLFENKLNKRADFEEIEETGISRLKVRSSSRDFENKVLSGNFEIEYRTNLGLLRGLGSEYKLYVYLILRLLKIRFEKGYFAILFEDYCNYLNKRTFSNNERYFYLSHLKDNMFEYEIDTVLWNQKSRRNFYRILYSKISSKNNIRLIDLIVEICKSLDVYFISKDRPKRLQRHKGYRDHGSLGSEFSKTLKDQSSDWSIIEEERQRKKNQKDFLMFLLGANGWI